MDFLSNNNKSQIDCDIQNLALSIINSHSNKWVRCNHTDYSSGIVESFIINEIFELTIHVDFIELSTPIESVKINDEDNVLNRISDLYGIDVYRYIKAIQNIKK